MNPAEIIFAAREKKPDRFDRDDDPCAGCLFEHAHSSVCHKAGEEAKRRGLEDCETGFIYVAVKVDPRQQDLFAEAR